MDIVNHKPDEVNKKEGQRKMKKRPPVSDEQVKCEGQRQWHPVYVKKTAEKISCRTMIYRKKFIWSLPLSRVHNPEQLFFQLVKRFDIDCVIQIIRECTHHIVKHSEYGKDCESQDEFPGALTGIKQNVHSQDDSPVLYP